jgi:hypothetical protein
MPVAKALKAGCAGSMVAGGDGDSFGYRIAVVGEVTTGRISNDVNAHTRWLVA